MLKCCFTFAMMGMIWAGLFLIPVFSAEIPEWAVSKINETHARFMKWKGHDEIVVFPLITDVHSRIPEIAHPLNWSDSKMHLLFLIETAKKFKADYIADLGDIGLDTPATLEKEPTEKRLESQLKLYAEAPVPVLFALGNHDHNGKGYRISSRAYGEMFNGWTRSRGYKLETGPDSDYGRYDLSEKKCRIIFLNTSDESYYGFSKNQLQFLSDSLQVPQGYSVIVMEHYCVLKEVGMWRSSTNTKAKRGEILIKILEDFTLGKKGTGDGIRWDFTGNRDASLIAVINGDSHYDNQIRRNGVNWVVMQGYGGISPKELIKGAVHRRFDRSNEMLIDVIAIKPVKKCFRIFRAGTGGREADREFQY